MRAVGRAKGWVNGEPPGTGGMPKARNDNAPARGPGRWKGRLPREPPGTGGVPEAPGSEGRVAGTYLLVSGAAAVADLVAVLFELAFVLVEVLAPGATRV